MLWRKSPILTLALGGYLRPGGAAGKILQETIDPETGEAVFLGFKAPWQRPTLPVLQL